MNESIRSVNKFTIIGGGFGLYGYLPALCDVFHCRVLLPEKYFPIIKSRHELVPYLGKIEWMQSSLDCLKNVSGVVVAVPPQVQCEFIHYALRFCHIEKLLLEKPLCECPDKSSETLKKLSASGKSFRIGYLFPFTSWYEKVFRIISEQKAAARPHAVRLTWSFLADHFLREEKVWKQSNSLGGGVLRFYGIHVLAILSKIGYQYPISSLSVGVDPDEPERWWASFAGEGLPNCFVDLSTKANERQFKIEVEYPFDRKIVVVDQYSPFGSSGMAGFRDPRVEVINELIHSLQDVDGPYNSYYEKVILLWNLVECKSVFNYL